MENPEKKEPKMIFEFNQHYFRIALYIVTIVAACALLIRLTFDWSNVIGLLSSMLRVISPFLVGTFIAFIMNPFVFWIKNYIFLKIFHFKKEKPALFLSIFIAYTLILGLVILLIMFVLPQIYRSIVDLTSQINALYFKTAEYLNAFQLEHKDSTFIDYDRIMNTLNNAVPQIVDYLTNITGSLVPFLYSAASTFIKGIYNSLIALIVSVYIISDQKNLIINIKRLIYALLPIKGRETIVEVLNHSVQIFSDFVWGKAIDSIIIGLINFIAMTLLHLKFAVLISVIVGITNMIPYFGPFIGGGIGAVILLITDPVRALIFVILILILQQFDGIFLGPKILGNSIGIKPLWVIFGITAGGSIAGFIGMFLGVPCVAVLAYIIEMFITTRLRQKNMIVIDGNVRDANNPYKPKDLKKK